MLTRREKKRGMQTDWRAFRTILTDARSSSCALRWLRGAPGWRV
jgi:hypothetical protein